MPSVKRWKKLGRLYDPLPIHPKLRSHAANPLPIQLDGDIYRIFFSSRDTENRSSVGCVDIDIVKRMVTYIHHAPVFEHGLEESCSSHGVSLGSSYEVNGRRYLLFMGWRRPLGAHWYGQIGRLRLHDDFSLSFDDGAPLMSLDAVDQISLSYPWVLPKRGGYVMWYGSTITWDAGNGEMAHVINSAESVDGDTWIRRGLAVPYEVGVAQAFSRPTVIVDSDGYHMWFSYRSGRPGETYRIGYAWSPSGDRWELRLDEVGLGLSDSGWDSEMVEYPFVFDHKGQRYLLYNGNGYGQSGFGLAVLDR